MKIAEINDISKLELLKEILEKQLNRIVENNAGKHENIKVVRSELVLVTNRIEQLQQIEDK